MVMQSSVKESSKTIREQKLELFVILGDQLNETQLHCKTCEKQFAIVRVLKRLDHMLWGPKQVTVDTKHKSLLYVFSSLAFRPNVPHYVLPKVYRWVIRLSGLDSVKLHKEGAKTVFIDLLRSC